MQLKVEKVKYGSIPCYVVYPIREIGKTVIFYHGWSSKGELLSLIHISEPTRP